MVDNMKWMGLFIVLIAFIVLAFFGISFASTVPKPAPNTIEEQQYNNLSQTTNLAFTTTNVLIYLILGTCVILALIWVMYTVFKRGG